MDTFELLKLYKKATEKDDLKERKEQRYLVSQFLDFCNEKEISIYDYQIGERFHEWLEQKGESFRVRNNGSDFIKRLNKIAGIKKQRKRLAADLNNSNQELLNNYLEYEERRGLKKSSIQNLKTNALYTLNYFKEIGYDDLSKIDGKELLIRYSSEKLPLIESSKYMSFLKWMYENKRISDELYKVIPKILTRERYSPNYYDPDEIKLILKKAADKNSYRGLLAYTLIFFIISTGLRSSDIRDIKLENIDLYHNRLEIRQRKTGVLIRMYINDQLKNIISNYLQKRPESESDYLFLNRKGEPLKQCYLYNLISDSIKESEVKIGRRKTGSHALRSTFASQLYKAGGDVDVINGLLGHSGMSSIKNYIASDAERLSECLIDVPLIDNRIIIARMKDYRHGI